MLGVLAVLVADALGGALGVDAAPDKMTLDSAHGEEAVPDKDVLEGALGN